MKSRKDVTVLIATMNVNQPDLTNNLVDQVSKDTRYYTEIMVLENGATEKSKYSTHATDKNYFFGGGLNLIFDYFLNETTHDYLFVLNNDLIIHGENFVSTMVDDACRFNLAQLSPAVVNSSIAQCHWKQMHNWMTGTVRIVKWIDFQAPLLRRDICEKIGQYPQELLYGWGNDILTGMIGSEYTNFTCGVSDRACITHLNSQTINKGIIDLDGNEITSKEYCRRAEQGMVQYMSQDVNRWNKFIEFRQYAETYNNDVMLKENLHIANKEK